MGKLPKVLDLLNRKYSEIKAVREEFIAHISRGSIPVDTGLVKLKDIDNRMYAVMDAIGKTSQALSKGKPIPSKVLADYPEFNPTCKVTKTHSDGDLTLKCKDGKYVVTTEGETFKEVKK